MIRWFLAGIAVGVAARAVAAALADEYAVMVPLPQWPDEPMLRALP